MSRLGKIPVSIPDGVKVAVSGDLVKVEGSKGKLEQKTLTGIQVRVEENNVIIERPNDEIESKVKHGTVRSLINNMVVGVSSGFEKDLVIEGVGYKAQMQGKKLVLNLGYSHPVEMEVPAGLEVKVGKPTEIKISGIDKQQVGFFAAKIRSKKEPEPYKGKGIRYSDEVIRRKAGKSVAK